VRNLSAAGSIPWALAGFLTALAIAAVGHALVMSVRARRREIAVLRTLGLIRRQVVSTVAAQATTTVLVGALVGVPLGIAAGRWSWALVATGLGVVDAPVVPALLIAAVIVGGAVLANVLASVPAAVASRLRPAAILRSE
jgi:ABC-type antimicrobial peptide transport system permease subunit